MDHGLWKLKYAQNGHFWRNNDFFMIFLCSKIEKLPKKYKSKKNVEKKTENLGKNELAQAATTCYLTLGKNIKEKLYI